MRIWFRKSADARWIWLLFLPFLSTATVGATLPPGLLWRPDDPFPYDVLIYHLQVPREWFELGRMTALRHNVYSFFPFNCEMHFAAMMQLFGGPWAGMYAAQFSSLWFSVLMLIGVYACTIELGAERKSAALASMIVAVMPWTTMLGCVAYVESFLLLFVTLCVGWTLVALRSERPIRPMIVAGALAGFAAGAKLSVVPILFVATPIAAMIVSRDRRRMFAASIAFFVAAIAMLSPWLIRNWAWCGNPIFPLAANMLGAGHFDSTQVQRFVLAHSAPIASQNWAARFSEFDHQILQSWQFGFEIWPLAAIAIVQQWKSRAILFCLIVSLCATFVWMRYTHLMGRFFVPTIPILATMIASIRWGRWWSVGAAMTIAGALLSWLPLSARFSPWAKAGRDGAFGIVDFQPFLPENWQSIEQQTDRPIVLVGDGQAFLHQVPTSRLRYRTVFDLHETSATDRNGFLSTWAGEPIESLDADVAWFVNPREISRLSQHFFRVPDAPPDLPGPRDESFVIDGKP